MATMEEYLRETPERVLDVIRGHQALMEEAAQRTYSRVIISGSGTSCHGGKAAKGFMRRFMGIPVEVLYPFEVETYLFSEPSTTLFIGISQSGTSLSTYRAMERAKAEGCRVASMAGREDEGTIINQMADDILTVACGEEGDLQPKTKGFFCTIANLMLFALLYGFVHGRISGQEYEEQVNRMKKAAEHMPVIINAASGWIDRNGAVMAAARDIRIVGTKELYGVTLEGALKLVETLRVPVSGYEFEEFIHGIYNAVNRDSVIILLDDGSEPRMGKMKEILSEWSDFVTVFGQRAADEKDFFVDSLGYSEYSFLEYILPVFMICEKVSAMKGINILTTKDTTFHGRLGSKILRQD